METSYFIHQDTEEQCKMSEIPQEFFAQPFLLFPWCTRYSTVCAHIVDYIIEAVFETGAQNPTHN